MDVSYIVVSSNVGVEGGGVVRVGGLGSCILSVTKTAIFSLETYWNKPIWFYFNSNGFNEEEGGAMLSVLFQQQFSMATRFKLAY